MSNSLRSLIVTIVISLLLTACSNESYIQGIVDEKQSTLPLKLDDQTTLIEIKAGKDAFIYIYTLIGQSDDDFIKSKEDIRQTIIKNLKQNMSSDIEAIFKRGIHYEYEWLNESRKLLFKFTVIDSDLGI